MSLLGITMYCVTCLCPALQADDYYIAGLAMAMSLVHGGPAPTFLSKPLYQSLVSDPERVKIPVSLLPDSAMKNDIQKVRSIFCTYMLFDYSHSPILLPVLELNLCSFDSLLFNSSVRLLHRWKNCNG